VRTFCLALIGLASAAASPQSTSGPFLVRNEIGRIRVEPSLRPDPPSSALGWKFAATSRERSITNGRTFYSRILLDRANRVYLGYELLLEQQEPGAYLATFGRLGVTSLDLAAGSIPTPGQGSMNTQSSTDLTWAMLPLPAIPEPRVTHDGDTISIELFVDAATGEKLIDDLHINLPRATSGIAQQHPLFRERHATSRLPTRSCRSSSRG
jgi:hypothetical protein